MENKPWQPDYPPVFNYPFNDDLSGEYPRCFNVKMIESRIKRQNLRAHNETVKIIMEIIK